MTRFSPSALAWVAATALLAAGCAAGPGPRPPAREQGDTLVRLVRRSDGKPIANRGIRWYVDVRWSLTTPSPFRRSGSGKTDDDGVVDLGPLPAEGQFVLGLISEDGRCEPVEFLALPMYDHPADRTGAAAIQDITIERDERSALLRVVDLAGAPIPMARVRLTVASETGPCPFLDPMVVDEKGEVRITGLANPMFWVNVETPGYAPTKVPLTHFSEGEHIHASVAEMPHGVELTLDFATVVENLGLAGQPVRVYWQYYRRSQNCDWWTESRDGTTTVTVPTEGDFYVELYRGDEEVFRSDDLYASQARDGRLVLDASMNRLP